MRADLPTSYRTRFPKENPGRIAMMLVVPAARSCAARPGAPSIRLEGEGRTIEAHRGAKRSLKRAARGARGAAAVCVGESNLRLVHVAAGVALRALARGFTAWGGDWCTVAAQGLRNCHRGVVVVEN